MHQNDQNILQIESEINIKKKQYKQYLKGKKLFLMEILKNGRDARNEGL